MSGVVRRNMINILGINITTLHKKDVLDKIGQFLTDGEQHYLVTPNPEIILEARRDEEFFYILNEADLSLPDGVGLKFAAWAMGRNLKRIIGADLVVDLLERVRITNNELRVGVINRQDGLSKKEEIENVLTKFKIKNFLIKNVDRGVKTDLDDLIKFSPDILFCALGAPWQEKFIYHALHPSLPGEEEKTKLPSVKIAIGVGGAFDFLTGKIKRAPVIIRSLCLEWLWRLFKQPWRIKRMYQAVVVFPWEFIKWRFINKI